MKRVLALAIASLLLGAQGASASFKINEIYFSPEDPKDDRQFFEIISTTGGAASLNNVWLLEIEGDAPIGVADNPGQVLNAFDLSAFSTGTNGLFLWRDSGTVLDTSPAPGVQGPDATTVVNTAAFTQIFGFEGPTEEEFQNNVHTFVLVEGYTGSTTTGNGVGDDLDPDEDGTLEVTPWTSVLDAVSQTETGDVGFQYAAQLGGVQVDQGFGADLYQRVNPIGDWVFFDSSSGEDVPAGFPGPFFANDGTGPGASDAAFQDGTEIVVFAGSEFLYATPGASNVIPEPTALALVSLAGLAAGFRRRR